MNKFIVIMAGGKGERFWPASRENKPKQLLPIISGQSILKETINRVKSYVDIDNVIIITRDIYKHAILEDNPDLKSENVLCEPEPKDTANAIALASIFIKKKYNDGLVTILPADHYIPDIEEFQKTIDYSFELINKYNGLITIGIKPDKPETGYGYIQKGNMINDTNNVKAYKVKSFKEKPNYDLATEYFNDSNYYWNSGIFVWKNSTFLAKYKEFLNENMKYIENIEKSIDTDNQEDIIKKNFPELKKISVDYGILEKCKDIICVEGNFKWDDLGSWSSLYEYYEKDDNGNASKGNSVFIESGDCLIHNDNDDFIIGTIGLDHILVIKDENGILVCNKNQDQKVKQLLKRIRMEFPDKNFT